MTDYDAVVIGAGLGGLGAGIELAANGRKVLICEASPAAGGLCTAFSREGFTFDACIHWLVGCGERGFFAGYLRKHGLYERARIRPMRGFQTIVTPDAEVTLAGDLSQVEETAARLSPRNARAVARILRDVRRIAGVPLTDVPDAAAARPLRRVPLLAGVLRLLGMSPMLGPALRYGRRTVRDLFTRVVDDASVRQLLTMLDDDTSALVMLMMLAWVVKADLFLPGIDSRAFAGLFKDRFLELGGELRLNAPVRRVLVDGNTARGVELEDGETVGSRVVISNADGHHTLFRLAGERYVKPGWSRFYRTQPTFGSMVVVWLGLDLAPEQLLGSVQGRPLGAAAAAFVEAPATVVEWGERGVRLPGIDNYDRACVGFRLQPAVRVEAAAADRCVLAIESYGNYQEWEPLRGDPGLYREIKEAVTQTLISRAVRRYPKIRGRITATETATPLTFERYTRNHEGSVQGWKMTPSVMRYMIGMSRTPTVIPNLLMAGQWVQPGGGVPTCLMSGEAAARQSLGLLT